jgi:hypothetical protein
MKKILVIVFGLMLGLTSVFGQSADVGTDVCDDVSNVVSSVLRFYANVFDVLEDTYDNSRKQEAERVSKKQFEEWAQDFMSYEDVASYFEEAAELVSLGVPDDLLDVSKLRNELIDTTKDCMQFAFMAGAISQYNLSYGTNVNVRNICSLDLFPSDADFKFTIKDLEERYSENTSDVNDDVN